MCPSAHAPTPAPALLGAARRGGSGVRDGCCCAAAPSVGSRCALPTRGRDRSARPSAARQPGPSEAMARVGIHLLLTVPRSAEAGVACVPKDTHASSSDSPQMFERSSKNAASSEAQPSFEHRRLPPRPRARGTRAAGSSFLGLPSFDEAKEGRCAAGRTSRLPPSAQACRQYSPTAGCTSHIPHLTSHLPPHTGKKHRPRPRPPSRRVPRHFSKRPADSARCAPTPPSAPDPAAP
jgi:hypothetical protein